MHEAPGEFLLPLDGMLVHRRVTPSIKVAGTRWREVLKCSQDYSFLPGRKICLYSNIFK